MDSSKIVVVKPAVPSDSTGSGWMDYLLLSDGAEKAYDNLYWYAGFGLWQYSSDVKGKAMIAIASRLKELCHYYKDCK